VTRGQLPQRAKLPGLNGGGAAAAVLSCIFDIRALWRSALSVRVPGWQKLQMTGLTRSGTRSLIAVPIWQQWASKG